MDKLKFTKIKRNIKDFIKYFGVGLYVLNDLLLVAFSVICYFYAIGNVANQFNLGNASNGGVKAISILLIVLVFLFVAIIFGLSIYFLMKSILNQIKNIDKDEIYFYYFGKKWILGLVSLGLGFLTLFGFKALFELYVPFFNSIFTNLLSISYFVCAFINFAFYFYSLIWFKRQPKEYQEKYLNIINQINSNKIAKKEIYKNTKIDSNSKITTSNLKDNNDKENNTEIIENKEGQ